MKKVWSKPKLISLYRGRPEEAVLGTCKDPSTGGVGPGDHTCIGGGECLNPGTSQSSECDYIASYGCPVGLA